MMNAAVSSGRRSFSAPLKARPIGVRTLSTMTASGMVTLLCVEKARRSHSTGGFIPQPSHSVGPCLRLSVYLLASREARLGARRARRDLGCGAAAGLERGFPWFR